MARNSIISSILIGSAAFAATAAAITSAAGPLETTHAAHVREWQARQATAPQRSRLEVDVSGVKPGTGLVMVGLYDSRTEFPKVGKHLISRRMPASGTTTKAVFSDVPYGNYAIAVIDDQNGNGKLDMRLGLLPKEPLGFSNGASVGFGPPKFRDASFEVDEPSEVVAIKVK